MTGAVLIEEGTADAGASFTIEGGPGVAADARAATEALRPLLGNRTTGELMLLLTELVTNAYLHSGAGDAPIVVEISVGGDRVRCVVADQGLGFTAKPAPVGERGAGGWGLMIVDRIADRWGVGAGRPARVWFELGLAG